MLMAQLEKTIMRMTLIIAASTVVLGTGAQAHPIMCKEPKTYFCIVNGCIPDPGLRRGEDVVILDMAEKVLTACKGRNGKCVKSKVIIEAGTEGYFISGPAMALRLIDNELTLALTDKKSIITQFFQCADPR